MTNLATFANVVTTLALAAVGTYAVASMWSQTYDNVVHTKSQHERNTDDAVTHAKEQADYFCNESRAVLRGRKYFDMCEEKTQTLFTAEVAAKNARNVDRATDERDHKVSIVAIMQKSLPKYCNATISEAVAICNATGKRIAELQKEIEQANEMLRNVR